MNRHRALADYHFLYPPAAQRRLFGQLVGQLHFYEQYALHLLVPVVLLTHWSRVYRRRLCSYTLALYAARPTNSFSLALLF